MIEIKLELRDDALQFYLRMIASHLDKHPELELVSYVHVVDGQWKHEVGLKKKNIGEFRR